MLPTSNYYFVVAMYWKDQSFPPWEETGVSNGVSKMLALAKKNGRWAFPATVSC
jgi:hypothetical protein